MVFGQLFARFHGRHVFFTWALPCAARNLNALMQPIRRAVIDVGTNSIKLLVADVAGRDVQPVHEESRQTRLGRGFYETRRLQMEPIAHSANAVADFARTARKHGARSIRVIATSAARDAVNPDDLISAIEAASKLKVEIISGGQEAGWAFQGVTTDPELAQDAVVVAGCRRRQHGIHSWPGRTQAFRAQFPARHGAVAGKISAQRPADARRIHRLPRLDEKFPANEVRPRLEPALRRESGSKPGEIQLVGTGGTTSILARMELKLDRYDRERMEATRLSLEQVKAHRKRLWSLPLAERKEITGLPKLRADVILPGVMIYEVVMEEFGFKLLRVSTRGLRFAAVMD